jgi:hypothetical protein
LAEGRRSELAAALSRAFGSRLSFVAVVLLLGLAAPAPAQEQRFDIQVGGGVTLPAGSITRRFETGWHATGGAGWGLSGHLGLRLDYTHSRERLVGTALPQAFVGGQHRLDSLELDVRWTLDPATPVRVEFLAGPGVFRRRTEINSVSDFTAGPSLCDPWLQVCAEAPVSTADILGSRSSTDPGFNLGAAVDIPIWRFARLFIELRWRFVWGDAYGLPGEPSQRSNASYFPLSFGLRF